MNDFRFVDVTEKFFDVGAAASGNAASIAALFLTTEAAVASKPEAKAAQIPDPSMY